MPSTTESGNAFRDAVCALLRTKYPDARAEQRVDGTKVDILFTRSDLGTKDVIAVECKDYASPLTKSMLASEIYPFYNVMLTNHSVQRVMVVSRKPLGADASDFMRGWRGATHLTYDELAESLLGIRPYVQEHASLQPTKDAPYIETRLDDRAGPALDYVKQWVGEAGCPGLAILGGYGQGKSSFAIRVAAHFAAAYLEDPAGRIPILIRLGEVVHETQLEGLFGKEFTARHHVPGYNFRTFELLNGAGRLLVILDGFDEMKHAMTAADFQSNFREFNRLLEGQAKVLLLGRPNALPSEERELVFRGLKTVDEQKVKSSAFASWLEEKMAFFEPEEAERLLTSTLQRLMERNQRSGDVFYAPNFLKYRVEEVLQKVPADLLRRPVHVKIIAELASNTSFDLAGFNEYKLYDHFIRTSVERDTSEKRARKAISLAARLEFQRELAWWAWSRPGYVRGFFHRDEVPTELLHNLPSGNAVDDEGKRNEYIVSTLTEEKAGGVLFFAHRSFQEFLVAERLRSTLSTALIHVEISSHITPEVWLFLKQSKSTEFVKDWYHSLRQCVGPLSLTYVDGFSNFPEILKVAIETPPGRMDLWSLRILQVAYKEGTTEAPSASNFEALLLAVVKLADAEPAAAAALMLIGIFRLRGDQVLYRRLVSALVERCLSNSELSPTSHRLNVQPDKMDFAFVWIQTVTRVLLQDFDSDLLSCDLKLLRGICIDLLKDEDMFSESPNVLVGYVDTAKFKYSFNVSVGYISQELSPHLKRMFLQYIRSSDGALQIRGPRATRSKRRERIQAE